MPSSSSQVNALVQSGLELHRAGRLQDAEQAYRRALEIAPNHPDALHFLGMITHQAGRHDEAVALLRRSLAVKPDNPGANNNLGVVLSAQGRLEESVIAFRAAIAAQADFADAHNNLGGALFRLGRLDEAVDSYRRALAIRPGYAEASKNLADALAAQGRTEDAELCYRAAIATNANYAEAHRNLGGMLYGMPERRDASLACYQRVLEIVPDDATARHMVAALSGRHIEHAPEQYVESMFDGYAERFDVHLAERLKYDIPRQMVALLQEAPRRRPQPWDVLDLGCGTGLVGSAIKPVARHLVGVDLSEKMLDRARAKGVYSRLEKSELLAMMRGEAGASYDVVTCADVFIYLGRMDEAVREASRLLREGGLFSFSIERLDAASMPAGAGDSRHDFALMPTGRFGHARAYVEGLAERNAFRVIDMRAASIRIEKGEPVRGWLALWEK